MKKFQVMSMALLALTAAVFCGCGGQPSTPGPEGAGAAKGKEAKARMEIAVIPKGLAHQFWLAVKAGADAAGAELGVDITWQGPAKETEIDKQISIIQDMIVRRVDGIVMAACDENALAGIVAQADAAGIPVVTFDSGVKSEVPKSLVATDNVAGAREAARQLAKLMGETGEVGLIPFVPGAATSEMRERGFREGIAEFPNMKIVASNYSQSDVSLGMNVTADMLTAFPNLGGIFSANEPGAIGAAQALRAAGKAGQVKLVAFDTSEEEIAALKEGVIQALMVQDPFKMGYEGVKAVVASIKGETVPKVIDTGVVVVTAENLGSPEVQKLISPR